MQNEMIITNQIWNELNECCATLRTFRSKNSWSIIAGAVFVKFVINTLPVPQPKIRKIRVIRG